IMASAPTMLDEKSNPSDSDSDSENDTESDSSDDSETTETYSSFDQSEEEDLLNFEDIVEEEDSGQLPCECEIKEEKCSCVDATDVRSHGLEKSGLADCKEILRNLSLLIQKTLSKATMVSLLKDFVESEFFLIDGDSLFITCLLNVNFKKGQTLHFFYIMEQFLNDFIQKEAKFVIVFFKDAEILYFKFPELQALRSALIQHLEKNTNVSIHTEFSNCLSPEWEVFLTECYPYFLVVSEKGLTPHQTEFLHIFILHALQKKINIVLPLGMESDVLRIYGYCTPSNYVHKEYFAKHEEKLGYALRDYLIDYFQKSQKTEIFLYDCLKLNLEDLQTEVHEKLSLLQNLWPEGADIRSVVCAIKCSVTLKFYKKMLHEAQENGSLNTDAENDSTQLNKTEFFILKQLEFIDNWKVNFAGLPDLTDNILWKNIAYYCEVEYARGLNLGMGDTLMQEHVKLWNIILTLSEIDNAGGPVPLRTTSRPFLTQKESSPRAKCKDAQARSDIQKLHHFYHFFGKSLVGNRTVNIVRDRALPPARNSAVQKKKKPQKTNAEKIIEENQRRQLAKEEKKEEERWNNLSQSIIKEIRENPNSGIKRLEDFLQTCSVKSVKFIAEMTGLEAYFKLWTDCCLKPDAESKDLNIIINLMKRIHIIHEKYSEQLQNTHRQKLAKYLRYIGFDNLTNSLCHQVKEPGPEKDISKYSVGMGAARFQLTYMGPFLFREERSDPDPRVHHFIPDTWQRELLDVVDNNESAVIVAPTSSGKTYASYYCMEKILRESDDGIVVYVAPTKALVNQVVGTVCNLFTKALPKGEAVCGVFTRDYRHDTLNCQILVTVPQCLEILLLSPHQQKWVKRVRYVIFDEVHCLGGEIGAEVWEHLLVMIRCPFLALSATISNPDHLTEWLALIKSYWQHVESKMENSGPLQNVSRGSKKQVEQRTDKVSHRVRLVWYKERYNDVEKYVCSLKGDEFLIEHYHPCAALTVNHIKKHGIPLDLGFSPRESILLYDAMVHIWPEWPRIQELEPEEFSCFKNKLVIKKSDVQQYEEELKKEMICWIELDPSKLSELLKYLKPQAFDCAESEKQRRFPFFVEKLKEMNKLPAIFFAFNIHTVEKSAVRLRENLTRKQNTHNDSNSEKEKKILIKKLFLNSGSCARIQRLILWSAEIQEIKKSLKKLYEVPADCTYADRSIVDYQSLMKVLHRLKGTRQGYKLHGLLRKGIGFHHGSMEYRERQVVELLFRLRHVKVVTATSSLALGINMPCKSVVFTEDSVFLDALNFRQMSGRAGRRGEDLVGNVFFYGIPLPKVERLLKSNVPKLKGQFPLSLSLILRLMLLVAKADDREDAKAKALSVLQHSLISFKQPTISRVIKFYFIYSLHFLVTEGYLNQECVPIGYSGLVSHLHYHEPANFVFVSLLLNGLFHKLCVPTYVQGRKTFSEDVMETLVVVLANLFGRKYLPPCVILNALPRNFAKVVKEYNSRIYNNFVSFLFTISKLADMKKECQLPLSEIDFPGKEHEVSELVCHLMPGTESRTAVSPFACLSNITDEDLFDIDVLSDAMLRTINMNINNIPFLCLNKQDKSGRKYPLNGYVLNFYKHGSLLNMGDAFNFIRDFTLVTQSIRYSKYFLHLKIIISLSELCDDENDDVVLAFKQLSETFKTKFWKKRR
ncbi:putative ATP-dependent RNA helicase DDX60, partial [Galemys pyrenaicus]